MVTRNKKALLISLKLILVIVIIYLAYINWNSKSYQIYRSMKVKNIYTYKSLLSHEFREEENISIRNTSIFISPNGNEIYFLESPLVQTEEIENQIETIEYQLDILERLKKDPEQFFDYNAEFYDRFGINQVSDFEDVESFKTFLEKYKVYGVSTEAQIALNDFLDVYTKTLNKKVENISSKQLEKVDKRLLANNLGAYDKGIKYSVDYTFSKIEKIELGDLFYGVRINELKGTILKIEEKDTNKYLTVLFSKFDFIDDILKNYAKSRYLMILYTALILLLVILIIFDLVKERLWTK